VKQVQKSRDVVEGEDAETRKRFGAALKELLAIIGTDGFP